MEVVHPGGGYRMLDAHLSGVIARPGTAVRRGDENANSGSTGNAVGAHLHHKARFRGRPVDPMWIVVRPNQKRPD